MASSNIIDDLSRSVDSQQTVVAYFYCDYADQRTLEMSGILGTLIQQLLNKTPIPEDVENQIKKSYANGNRSPDVEELIDILCSAVQLFSATYLIIDGLDECRDAVQKDAMVAVKQLAVFEKSTIKVFISTREEPRISEEYSRIQLSSINLSRDIVSFVSEKVKERIVSGELVIQNHSLEQEIIAELVAKAHGM